MRKVALGQQPRVALSTAGARWKVEAGRSIEWLTRSSHCRLVISTNKSNAIHER